MKKLFIQFINNKDGISCSMLINHQLVDKIHESIPFNQFLDLRGVSLFLLSREWNDFTFQSNDIREPQLDDDEINKLKKMYDYMFNPTYVLEKVRK